MARDINEIILTGEACTKPCLIPLKNNKKLCIFNIKNLERYTLANGQPAAHENILQIEILGPRAEQQAQEIQMGQRYLIKGYLRMDEIGGADSVRVRAFRVELE